MQKGFVLTIFGRCIMQEAFVVALGVSCTTQEENNFSKS